MFKDNEIDIIALNENNGEILSVECKWSENMDPVWILQSLKIKPKLVNWKKNSRSEKYILLPKSFTKTLHDKNVEMIDLKQ